MERTVLAGAMLVVGSGTPPVAGRAVVVERDRIVGVVAEADAPPARTTLRLDGLMLLPGLVNCHVRLCFGAEANPAAATLKDPSHLGGRDYAELSVRDTVRARRPRAGARARDRTGGAVRLVMAWGRVIVNWT